MKDPVNENIFLRVFDSTLDRIKHLSGWFLFMLMSGMGCVLGLNIVTRYIFEWPISWSNSVSRYAYIFVVLLGTAISYMEGSHAKIDALYNIAPKWLRVIFDLFHYLVLMFVCLVLIVIGSHHVGTMWNVKSPYLTFFPIGIVYLSVPLSAAIIFLFLIRKIIALFRREESGSGKVGHFLS